MSVDIFCSLHSQVPRELLQAVQQRIEEIEKAPDLWTTELVLVLVSDPAVEDEIRRSAGDYAKKLGLKQLYGEKGFTTLERLWARPTLECNGIWGGYTGEGAKTVLPAKAFAKISMRLVPNQSAERIAKLFERHLKRIAPKSVAVKVEYLHGGEPARSGLLAGKANRGEVNRTLTLVGRVVA